MSNQIQKVKFSTRVKGEAFQELIRDTLSTEEKVRQFTTSIISAVANNTTLQECEHSSILSCGLLGATLNLVPGNQLGHFYMVPFKKKDKSGKVVSINAQFVLGYKGYLQLAIRSGYYKKINVTEIKSGELISYDPLEEEIKVKLVDDFEKRENAETIGYYAMFEYTNGFKKAMYWSKAKMLSHADKYSQGFNLNSYRMLKNGEIADRDKRKYSSNWYQDFDEMAKKTMLRQLLSKWGIMSLELQQAIESDDKVVKIDDDGTITTDMQTDVPEVEEVTPVQPVDEFQQDDEFSQVDKNEEQGQVSLSDL